MGGTGCMDWSLCEYYHVDARSEGWHMASGGDVFGLRFSVGAAQEIGRAHV